jgi:NAD(P)-dependent dehydrogenase (short-subunit alcohol dehydrogenase family)
MRDKICLVTGANSGHGRAVALELLKRGATVILGCRNEQRAEEARASLTAQSGNERASVLQLDLSERASVRRAAEQLLREHRVMHVLLNNAGALYAHRRVSNDGIELVWASNVLGPHLLTELLMPALERSGAGRLINVASSMGGGLELDDVQFSRRRYSGLKAYEASKQANRMLSWAWAARLKGSHVVANALSPGFVRTRLGRNAPLPCRVLLCALRPFQTSPERAAATAIWLATSTEAERLSDGYWVDRNQRACEFRDSTACEQLWQLCAEQLSG